MDLEPPRTTPSSPAPDLSALTRVEEELAEVQLALGRLDDGSYGTCQACGVDIADERLAAEPTTATCAAHAPS